MSLFAVYGQDCPVRSDGSSLFIIVFDGRGESEGTGGSRSWPATDSTTVVSSRRLGRKMQPELRESIREYNPSGASREVRSRCCATSVVYNEGTPIN